MPDGSITFSTELDNKKLQTQLGKLKREMKSLEKSTAAGEAKKAPLVEQAERLKRSVSAATEEVGRYRREWLSGVAGADKSQTAAIEKAAQLEGEYARVVAQIDKIDAGLQSAYSKMDDIASSAVEIEGTLAGQGAGGVGERVRGAFSAVAGGVASLLSKTLSAVRNIGVAAGGVLKNMAASAVSAFSQLNVFSRLSDKLAGKFKRLSSTVKSALIYSVVYKGLASIREQFGAYLSVNDELMAALARLKGSFAVAFQPIYDAVVPALRAFVESATVAANTAGKLIAAMFGTTTKKAKESAVALEEEASALKDAGKAADKTGKSMANFDELNQLIGGGGEEEQTAAPEIDFSAVEDTSAFDSLGAAFDSLLDKIISTGIPAMEQAFDGFAGWVNHFSIDMVGTFEFPDVLSKVKELGVELAEAFQHLVESIDWAQLGAALGAGLNTALAFLVSFIYTFDWLGLGSSLADLVNSAVSKINWLDFGRLLFSGFKVGLEMLAGLLQNLDMAQLAKAASDTVIGFFNSMTETIQKIDWKKIGEQIRDFLVNVDWAGVAKAVFTALGAAFGAAAEFLWGLIGDAWQAVVDWWHDKAFEDGKFTLMGLLEGIVEVIKNIGAWIKENIFDPFIEGFKSVFGIHSPSTVMAEMGGYLVEGLLNGIVALVDRVLAPFEGVRDSIKEILGGIVDFIAGAFTADWGRAWDGVTAVFSGVWNGIIGTIEGAVNTIIQAVNFLISQLNKVKVDVPEWIPGIGGKSFGINIPTIQEFQIPRLAQGAVIPPNREFMAVLGDQKSGTNIETPLETMVGAFKTAYAEMGVGGAGASEMHLYVHAGAGFVRELKFSLDDETRRRGVKLTQGT